MKYPYETPKNSTIEEINSFSIGTVFFYNDKKCIVSDKNISACEKCIFTNNCINEINCFGRIYLEK